MATGKAFLWALLFTLVVSSPAPSSKVDNEYRISAATPPYFACDNRVVEDRWQLERFAVPPKRHPKNPLIVRETRLGGYGTAHGRQRAV